MPRKIKPTEIIQAKTTLIKTLAIQANQALISIIENAHMRTRQGTILAPLRLLLVIKTRAKMITQDINNTAIKTNGKVKVLRNSNLHVTTNAGKVRIEIGLISHRVKVMLRQVLPIM